MDYINSKKIAATRVGYVRKVRGWIEDALRLRTDLNNDNDTSVIQSTVVAANSSSDSDDDKDDLFGYTVLVQEMTCNIPGCAPIETVVALLKSGSNHNGKIFKPIAEVTIDEAKELVERMLGGANEAEHMAKTEQPTTTKTATTSNSVGEVKSSATMQTDNDPHPFLCPCCNPEVTKFDKVRKRKRCTES
jgi:hypothetical protein